MALLPSAYSSTGRTTNAASQLAGRRRSLAMMSGSPAGVREIAFAAIEHISSIIFRHVRPFQIWAPTLAQAFREPEKCQDSAAVDNYDRSR